MHVTGVTAALSCDWPPRRVHDCRLRDRQPGRPPSISMSAGGASTTGVVPPIRMVNSGTDQEGCKNAESPSRTRATSSDDHNDRLGGRAKLSSPGASPSPVRRLLVILLVAPITVGGIAYANLALRAAGQPSFAMAVSPSVQTAPRGGATSFSVDVPSLRSFGAPVRLMVSGLPHGVRSSWALSSGAVTTSPTNVQGGAKLSLRVALRARLGRRRPPSAQRPADVRCDVACG